MTHDALGPQFKALTDLSAKDKAHVDKTNTVRGGFSSARGLGRTKPYPTAMPGLRPLLDQLAPGKFPRTQKSQAHLS